MSGSAGTLVIENRPSWLQGQVTMKESVLNAELAAAGEPEAVIKTVRSSHSSAPAQRLRSQSGRAALADLAMILLFAVRTNRAAPALLTLMLLLAMLADLSTFAVLANLLHSAVLAADPSTLALLAFILPSLVLANRASPALPARILHLAVFAD